METTAIIVSPKYIGLGFMGTVSQIVTIVKKPLFPPLVHDDTTRFFVCAVGIVISLYILYRTIRSLNE